MGRAPCCEKEGLKKGPWTPEEDQKLVDYIKRHGHGCWRALPKRAGLLRCGKSCRLRWTNYLRPDIKRGKFSLEEEQTIIQLHGVIGNRWSAIAAHLPGRTDNEIKNYWNTHLRKRLLQMGIDPVTHRRRMDLFDFGNVSQFLGPAFLNEMTARLESARLQEAMTREYYRRIAEAAMIPQQQNGQYNQNGADEVLMRSQLENPFSSPDFVSNSISSHLMAAQNPENQVGSLEYNALVSQALEQLQSQAQIMKNMQHHPSTVNGLNPLPTISLEDQGNNHVFSDRACVAPHQKLNANQTYNNFLNASTLMDVNSSLAFDASILWPQENLIGVCKSDSESLPALVSSSSSPNIFSDSDLGHDASSSMLNMNVSSTASTTMAASNASYASPLEFLFDFSANSKQNEKIPQDSGDYWSNILQYVGESGVDKDLGLQSIYEQ